MHPSGNLLAVFLVGRPLFLSFVCTFGTINNGRKDLLVSLETIPAIEDRLFCATEALSLNELIEENRFPGALGPQVCWGGISL